MRRWRISTLARTIPARSGFRGGTSFSRTAITAGRGPSERVNEVMSFTGQSLDGPDGSALLRLPSSAVEYVPPPPRFKEQRAGNMQAAVLEYERGRVIVLGEAGMLTAQVDDGTTFGMNVPGVDNRQFTLNLVRWLSRLL
jgi:hypothetical protein